MDPNVRPVVKLNYLTFTRSDISFSISVVSQFLNSPSHNHWDVVIQIFNYMKESPRKQFIFCDRGNTNIIGYSYVDWAKYASGSRSTSGYCVFIDRNLISWKNKK